MNVLKIKAKNYLSFKSLDLDLTDKDGTFLIIGRNSENVDDTEGNGSGKTSFASLVTYAFYGRCRGNFDKELHNEDIIFIDVKNAQSIVKAVKKLEDDSELQSKLIKNGLTKVSGITREVQAKNIVDIIIQKSKQ